LLRRGLGRAGGLSVDAAIAQLIARREQVLAKVRRMLIVSLRLRRQPDEIDPDTSLFGTGLGMDSLDAVEVVVALEIEFGIKLEDALQRKLALRSVNALVDLVLAKETALASA
jgi:acyl carrier protein